jgi:DNA-directed RNA polymerase II subunit RPB1
LGVPRLKEILNVSECPRTPSMTVYLQDNVSRDQDIAKLVHSMLEYTILGDIAILTEIHYDPNIRNSVVLKDKEFVKDYYEMSNESEADLLRLSRYVLRIELDHVMCYDKKIQMNAIVREIESVYGQDLNAIASDDNAENLVVRVRIVSDVINSLNNDDEGSIGSTEDKSLLEEDWILLKRLEKVCLQNNIVL